MQAITPNFISTFTTDKSISTGAVAQMDFARSGRIDVRFHFGQKTIGLSIAGFESGNVFHLFPQNQKECQANQYWLERYVLKCHHASDIIMAITKIQTHHHNPFTK